MPQPDPNLLKEVGNTLWKEEMKYSTAEQNDEHVALFKQLNPEQRTIYDAVMDSIENHRGKLFFVYGPGGTGKTFLYRTIISKIRSTKGIVLPVASSGIAALLLSGGRTAHSRFKIPFDVTGQSVCHIMPGTMLAELIKKTDLIIWDEAPMAHRHTFEALDRTLKDIMGHDNPEAKEQTFGGKTVLLGGDFRQILPVIPQGTRADTVMASISESYLWESCQKYILKKNMRLQDSDGEFANWVLRVGDGDAPTIQTDHDISDDGQMVVVDNHFLRVSSGNTLKEIIDAAYGNHIVSKTNKEYYTERAILTP
ncbi:uncharacterized protein LOC112084412 [Eutrema salsugineum]|uniref:uncharacterized protein LOC112084412 n=1 Tax=Eutrema salsugineum TaxID=72664 RepID=UPI000CED1607|nr:uncharacterized protein LOC112084412 [Eutrema salsugineum]